MHRLPCEFFASLITNVGVMQKSLKTKRGRGEWRDEEEEALQRDFNQLKCLEADLSHLSPLLRVY